MTSLIILIVIAALGALGFTVYRTRNRLSVVTSARLSRYGLGAKPVSQVVSPQGSQSAVTQAVERSFGHRQWFGRLGVKLEQADLKMLPAEFIIIDALAVLIGAAVGYLLHGILGLLVLAVLGFFAPRFWLNRRLKKRKRQFIEQLADIAQMMGNSMRAGFSILQSMELVGKESPAPASVEFERVTTEVKLGLTVEAALDHLLSRMPSEDLELMVVAINVQRQVGGNLAEILMVISNTIRERVRFERDLKALTAQARYSSYIITALPVGVAVAINFLDQSYEKFLYTNIIGYFMIATSVVMLSIGFFILNKIANIEV